MSRFFSFAFGERQSEIFGLVGARSGKKMPLSSVEHILKNPFYYGHFLYRGEIHQGNHKPIISKKLFDQIQEALILNGKPRKKQGPKNFQFLNFARCGECGYCVTAGRKIREEEASGKELMRQSMRIRRH